MSRIRVGFGVSLGLYVLTACGESPRATTVAAHAPGAPAASSASAADPATSAPAIRGADAFAADELRAILVLIASIDPRPVTELRKLPMLQSKPQDLEAEVRTGAAEGPLAGGGLIHHLRRVDGVWMTVGKPAVWNALR